MTNIGREVGVFMLDTEFITSWSNMDLEKTLSEATKGYEEAFWERQVLEGLENDKGQEKAKEKLGKAGDNTYTVEEYDGFEPLTWTEYDQHGNERHYRCCRKDR
jgi:hypothetical protein